MNRSRAIARGAALAASRRRIGGEGLLLALGRAPVGESLGQTPRCRRLRAAQPPAEIDIRARRLFDRLGIEIMNGTDIDLHFTNPLLECLAGMTGEIGRRCPIPAKVVKSVSRQD